MTISTDDVLGRLAAIHPLAGVRFEATCFALASAHLNGYVGGAWSADEIAGIGIYVPPGEEGARVTLACPGVYESHETDLRTAGAAITLVALNQLCWHFHERGLTGVSDACSDLFHRARTEFFADTAGLDARTLYAYID